MSHLLAFRNLVGATVLAGSTLVAWPAAAQTNTQSDSGLTPIPACVPANTASGYTLPDTSGYTLVAQHMQPRAELCITPNSPSLSNAAKDRLVTVANRLADAFAAYPDKELPLSARFPGKPHEIEISSPGASGRNMTYLFTITNNRKGELVTGQMRLSRPAASDSEDAPGVKNVPYSAPVNALRLAT